jgi:uncharacterized membrane protein
MFILFLIWEWRQGDAAMIPMAMLKTKVIWSAGATLFFLLGAILAAEYYLAMYFQTVKGNSPVMSGVHILPTTISLLTFTMVSGMMSTFSPFSNTARPPISLRLSISH